MLLRAVNSSLRLWWTVETAVILYGRVILFFTRIIANIYDISTLRFTGMYKSYNRFYGPTAS